MEILICVKQVPDDTVEIHLDPGTGTPDLSRAALQASAFETYGLEMAARYVEDHGGSVTVVTAGAKETDVTVRNLLAVGANRGMVLLQNEEMTDGAGIARVIGSSLSTIEEKSDRTFDLIIAGRESTDYIDGEVGLILAEILDRPLITNVVEFSESEGRLRAKKEMDSGYQLVEAELPAVITVSKPDYDPRYPTIKSKMAARKVEIPVLQVGIPEGENRVWYLGYMEPPARDAGEVFSDLSPEDAANKIIEMIRRDRVM